MGIQTQACDTKPKNSEVTQGPSSASSCPHGITHMAHPLPAPPPRGSPAPPALRISPPGPTCPGGGPPPQGNPRAYSLSTLKSSHAHHIGLRAAPPCAPDLTPAILTWLLSSRPQRATTWSWPAYFYGTAPTHHTDDSLPSRVLWTQRPTRSLGNSGTQVCVDQLGERAKSNIQVMLHRVHLRATWPQCFRKPRPSGTLLGNAGGRQDRQLYQRLVIRLQVQGHPLTRPLRVLPRSIPPPPCLTGAEGKSL